MSSTFAGQTASDLYRRGLRHRLRRCQGYAGLTASATGPASGGPAMPWLPDGLRRRAGLRAWPILRRGEAAVAAQIRQVLGAERFDQVFAAGSGLSQREAAAAVRGRPDPGT